MNFVYDVEKTIFSRVGGHYQSIQMAYWPPALPEPTSGRKLTRTYEPRNIHRTNEELPELTSFRVFTGRTKKLAEPTSFKVFTERKRKFAEPTRLRILTERTKQRQWLLLMENSRNDVFQPLSRTLKNGSNQEYSR